MYNEIAAQIFSFFSMSVVAASYFFKEKSKYLFLQALSMLGLIFSYFFSVEFFAMVGLFISALRTTVFYVYEKKQRKAPPYLSYVFAGLTVASYIVVNLIILKDAKPLDIICMVALISYSFIFRIRNLKVVRYTMIFPLSLSILYNIFCEASIFVVCSYAFELLADLFSIVKYHWIKGKDVQTQAENICEESKKE